MQDILIVVDMQNDFIDGALGTAEAVAIVPRVVEKVKDFKGTVIFTRDTHGENYMQTQEGRNLPVPHCILGTDGWQIAAQFDTAGAPCFDKPSFGSTELIKFLTMLPQLERVEFVGLCTDICVITNVMMLKGALPELPIAVRAACCAGVTPESHENALNAMRMCQIAIV